MDHWKALFTFHGRASRLAYWRMQLLATGVLVVMWVVTIFVAMGAGDLAAIPLILMIPVLIPLLAVCVRRLHDRNKSGWWLLIFWVAPFACLWAAQALTEAAPTGVVPALGVIALALFLEIWGLFEIGLLRGSPGENRFGPPPPSGLRRRGLRPA